MLISTTCTACRACEQLCSKHAISLKENDESFLVADIDADKCISCGLCHASCPQENSITIDRLSLPKAWAAVINNREILKESSSGGVFTALALEVLRSGGVVFGVEFQSNMHAVHTKIECEQDLAKIRSSKYLASDTKDSYSEVKKLLKIGVYVLYSGLPCQIGGLRAYLRKDYDNLLLVDIICHGTPSIKLFDVYLEGLQSKYGSQIYDYKFRDKSKRGWGCYWSYKYGSNSKKNGGQHDDPYVTAFIDGYAKRDSCYFCKYVGFQNRPGDITLGDYWGIDMVHPNMASNDGVSAVIANTSKGESAVKKAFDQCTYVESTVESIGLYNPSFVTAEKRPTRRDHLYDGIYTKPSIQFLNENLKVPFYLILKTKFRLIIPYKARVLLKRFKKLIE